MPNLYLDPDTNDVVLEGGALRMTEGAEAVPQRIRVRLQTHKGEWMLDTDVGMPYREEIFQKDADPELVLARTRGEVLQDDEVTGTQDLVAELDEQTREIVTSGTVQTIYGPLPV